MKKIFLSALSILILAAFTSCSQSMESDTTGGGASFGGASAGGASGGIVYDEALAEGGAGEKPAPGGDVEAAAPELAPDGFYDMAEGDFEPGAVDGDVGIGEINGIVPAAGTLTAGEWIDNDHYTFWQNLYQKTDTGWESYRKAWNRSFSSRIFVTVSANGKPVENETVTLAGNGGELLWTAKTDNEGKAYLFYSASELSKGSLILNTESGGRETITSENSSKPVAIDIKTDNANGKKALDLSLVVDTTGSMSDELSYLQKELESVVSRVKKDNGNIPVRLSVTFYRDDGDEYVVRKFDFTDNISDAINNLNAQEADGGGDTPEKVHAALDAAINELSWSENSTKLMFIILDAPPHSDDKEAVEQMNSLTEQSAAKGIRLIPILASGGDKETEFLMRDFALKTGGSYLFLTDDSGVSSGQHIEPTVGDYEVEKLNDLMVKVIDRYIRNCDKPAEFKDEKVEEKAPETLAEPQINPQIQPRPVVPAKGVVMEPMGGAEGSIDFEIINNTENDYFYGLSFDLEHFKDGEWIKISPLEDMTVIEIAMLLPAGTSNTFNAPIEEYFGELLSGTYRVVLNLSGESGNITVYGEFGHSIIVD